MDENKKKYYESVAGKYLKKYICPIIKEAGISEPKNIESFISQFDHYPKGIKAKINHKISMLENIGKPSISYFKISKPIIVDKNLTDLINRIQNKNDLATSDGTKYKILDRHMAVTTTELDSVMIEVKFESDIMFIDTLEESYILNRTHNMLIRIISNSSYVEMISSKNKKNQVVLQSIIGLLLGFQKENNHE